MTTGDDHKKFARQARHSLQGEAFFEVLVSDHSLAHKVTGQKDIGIDFICEWTCGDRPSGVLYAVQVKTLMAEYLKCKPTTGARGYNRLTEYTLKNSHLKIDERTLSYWKGMGLPVYLFVVSLDSDGSPRECYYKRYTPLLTKEEEVSKGDHASEFYKVNDGNRFLAFSDDNVRVGGFARDLFIDYARCHYSRGSIVPLNPQTLGLAEFPDKAVFRDLLEEYKEPITQTWLIVRELLPELTEEEVQPAPENSQLG